MTIRELDTGCIHGAAIVGTSNTTYSSGRWIGSAVVIDPVSYLRVAISSLRIHQTYYDAILQELTTKNRFLFQQLLQPSLNSPH